MSDNRHLFLSYRSTEVDFALRLASDLKNAGINLWMDRLDIRPGDDWRMRLQEAVNQCAVLIPVLSPDYVRSKYCRTELARADRMAHAIFPVLLRNVAASEWPFEVERHHYVDFTGWPDEAAYQQSLQTLIETIKRQGILPASVPNAESRYLNSFIAKVEIQKGIRQTLEVDFPSDEAALNDGLLRPRPAMDLIRQGAYAALEVPSSNEPSGYFRPSWRRKKSIELHEFANLHPRFVLIGESNSGKTLTLQQLALEQALQYRESAYQKCLLPLLLDLANWRGDITFEAFIRAHWPLPRDMFKHFRKGRIVLYLDGLSEIPDFRDKKVQMLREWLNHADSPQQVILSCRITEYHSGLNLGLPIIQIVPMEVEQIERFVITFMDDLHARDFLPKMLPQQEAHYLYQEHRFRMARHPFLLSSLMFLYHDRPDNALPQSRGALVQAVVRQLWAANAPDDSDIVFEDCEAALTELAFAMIVFDMPVTIHRDVAIEHLGSKAMLDIALNMHLLDEVGEHIRFTYQMMQDYFAARRLAGEPIGLRLQFPHFDAYGHRIAQKWDRVIIMLCGIATYPDRTVAGIADIDPYLALQCVVNGVCVSEVVYEQIINQLLYYMREDDHDGRVTAASILGEIEPEITRAILIETMRDGTWKVRQAAYWMLWTLEIPVLEGLCQAIKDWEQDMREATMIALRQLGEEALPTLLQLLQDESWNMRRGAAWALGQLRDFAAVPGLVEALTDADGVVVIEAASALSSIRDPEAVTALLNALHYDSKRVRNVVATALGYMGAAAIEGLVEKLNDPSEEIRRLVIEALKAMDDPAVQAALLRATYDENIDVRSAAIEALEDMEDPVVIKRLIECLTDRSRARWSKNRICDIAARILETFTSRQAREAVETWRAGPASKPDNDGYVPPPEKTTASADVLKKRLTTMKRNEPRTSMLSTQEFTHLSHPDSKMRAEGVEMLGNNEAALPILSSALHDEDVQVRLVAVKMLSGLKSNRALEMISEGLADSDQRVGVAAATALAHQEKQAPRLLTQALQSFDVNVKGAALIALKQTPTEQATVQLIDCLNSQEHPWLGEKRVCDLAAEALIALGTPTALLAVEHWRQQFEGKKTSADAREVEEDTQPAGPVTPPDKPQQRKILQELLDSLRRGEQSRHTDAARALREYAKTLHKARDPLVVRQLSEAMEDPQWTVRWACAEALAWIADPSALPALARHVDDPKWMVRLAVVRAMQELADKKAVSVLENRLTDKKELVREAAAEALGHIGDKSAMPGLVKALSDEADFVRLAGVIGLANIQDPSVAAALCTALKDTFSHVRWAAVEILGQILDPETVPDLIISLKDEAGPHWEKEKVCDLAAAALERIGTPEALKAVKEWRESKV